MVAAESSAYLLAIVEVDKADRILCQADGCGHSVYKRIHVVLASGEFKVLGSNCYYRLYSQTALAGQTPQYGAASGRLLTPAERLVLVENTAAFIEALEAERVKLESAAALKIELERVARAAAHPAAAKSRADRPVRIASDARSPMYEGTEMLRWRWMDPVATAASLAEYEACPSNGLHHDRVVAAFKKRSWPTPYALALEVELKQFLPKPYVLRALDELHLIERAQADD